MTEIAYHGLPRRPRNGAFAELQGPQEDTKYIGPPTAINSASMSSLASTTSSPSAFDTEGVRETYISLCKAAARDVPAIPWCLFVDCDCCLCFRPALSILQTTDIPCGHAVVPRPQRVRSPAEVPPGYPFPARLSGLYASASKAMPLCHALFGVLKYVW